MVASPHLVPVPPEPPWEPPCEPRRLRGLGLGEEPGGERPGTRPDCSAVGEAARRSRFPSLPGFLGASFPGSRPYRAGKCCLVKGAGPGSKDWLGAAERPGGPTLLCDCGWESD